MIRPRMLGLVGLTAAVLLVAEHGARGFSFFLAGGQVVVWPGATSTRWLSPGTFPPDSDPDVLYRAAMGLWNVVPACDFAYTFGRNSQDFPIDHFDGFSDTVAVPAEDLDPGVLGVTFLVNSGAQWFDMDMVFPDVPDNTGWNLAGDPNCLALANPLAYGYSFYLTATHELGHALGLGHDPVGTEPAGAPWFIATMNPRYPTGGSVGDQDIIELHTDDRSGVRFLYPRTGPSGPPVRDLALGNFGWSPTPGQPVPLAVSPASAPPGAEVQLGSVIENFGTTSEIQVRQGFYLSKNRIIRASNDTLLGTLLWDIAFENAIEFTVAVDLPADIAAGTYWLGAILDDDETISELYEDNNTHRYCAPLTITQLPPAFEPLGGGVAACGVPFSGPTPVVSHPLNMAPLSWSLDAAPAGVQIDSATGVISWDDPVAASFQYSIVVRATNAAGSATGSYLLGVEKAAPVIAPIGDASLGCGAAYFGPVPQLADADCMSPILNWSLDAGPAGMQIDFGSGQVSWPAAAPGTHAVRIRATNVVGHGTRAWQLVVSTIPGDTNADGVVDLDDLLVVLAGFGACAGQPAYPPAADFDASGCIDLDDLLTVLGLFGSAC